MINKIKDLISNFSSKEEIIEESDLSSLNNACAALLVRVLRRFARIFSEFFGANRAISHRF